MFPAKDFLKDVESREKALSTRGEQVSGKLNEIESNEFEHRLRKLSEEWLKAKERLNEQRELLEDGIYSCMKHLEIVDKAKSKATEIDELLSEINAAKDENMETVDSKTQVLYVSVVMSEKYCNFFCNLLNICRPEIPNIQAKEQLSTEIVYYWTLSQIKRSPCVQEYRTSFKNFQISRFFVCPSFR